MEEILKHMTFFIQNSVLLERLSHYTGKARKDKGMRVFGITFLYLFLLLFCSSNSALLLMSLVYFIILNFTVRNFSATALICFAVTLAFMKGKSLSILMIPEAFVHMNVARDVMYYFSITLSDFFLGIALWLYIREAILLKKTIRFSGLEALLGGLMFASGLSGIFSMHLDVTMLSTLQIGKLLIVYHLWKFVSDRRAVSLTIMAMSALVLFESMWGFLQLANRGPLGRYIESVNLLYTYGKTAWENPELLRISGTFVDPDIFGTFLYMHALLFLTLFLLRRSKSIYEQWIFLACAFFASTGLYLTGNRMLYVLFATSFAILVIKTNGLKRLKTYVSYKTTLLLLVVATFVLAPYVYARMQNLATVFSRHGSATFRLQMLDYSTRLGFSNVFGVGSGTSPYHFATQFAGEDIIFGPDYPHNIFLHVFAETGIFGFLALFLFSYFSFRALFVRGVRIAKSHYLLAAFAYFLSAQFYPIYIPMTELIGYFFIYLGISQSERIIS